MRNENGGYRILWFVILGMVGMLQASEPLLFYSQPIPLARENLEYFQRQVDPPRRIIPLIGEYHLYDDLSGVKLGEVTVPSVFFDKRPLIFQKSFPQQESRSGHYILHFERLNGWVSISLNDRPIFEGSRNFLPLALAIPAQHVCQSENLLKVRVIPWEGQMGQLPNWFPLNLPRINNGLNGGVYLEVIPETYIKEVSVPDKRTEGSVTVKGEVIIESSIPLVGEMNLNLQILEDGKPRQEFEIPIPPDSLHRLMRIPLEIPGSSLSGWTPGNPVQIQLRAVLRNRETVVDEIRRPLSHREIYFKQDGMMLNDTLLNIKGINYIYQDPQGLSLLNRQLIIQDLQAIKAQGFNSIRVGYFPLSPVFYHLTDSLGLLCFQDLPFPLLTGDLISDSIWLRQCLSYIVHFQEMADRHPSIVGIGLANFFSQLQTENMAEYHQLTRQAKQEDHYIFYLASFTPPPRSPLLPDLYFFELLERNFPDRSLKSLPVHLSPGLPVLLSALSRPVTYRVDSITVTHDLKQLGELTRKFSQENWKAIFAGSFIYTYSDYIMETPAIQAGRAHGREFRLNSSGLYGLDRAIKKDADLILKQKWGFLYGGTPSPPQKQIREYIFIIIGLINFFIFLFIYRSFVEFRKNIFRALRKPHGFFVELLERRMISYEQSFYLLLVISLNAAVIITGILFFFRNNLYVDYLISLLFFSPQLKQNIARLIWTPYLMIPVLTLLVMIAFILLALPIQGLSFIRKSNIRLRQSVATSAWAAAPFLLLLPFGMFFYSLLLTMNSYWILFGVLLYFHLWYVLRWLNGTRVMALVSYARVFMYMMALIIVFGGAAFWYLQSKVDLLLHLNVVFQMLSFHL